MRRYLIAGRFHLRLASALLLLLVTTRVALAADPSIYDSDYDNISDYDSRDAEFKSVVGAALVFLFLGAFTSAYVLYRSYIFITTTELESIPGCLRLPLYAALLNMFLFALNSVNFWHSIIENEPWSKGVCKPVAALLDAFYCMTCYMYVSFSFVTTIRVSSKREIRLGMGDYKLWLIVFLATLVTVLMQVNRYGRSAFWCSVEDRVENVVLEGFFVLVPFCSLLFCSMQIRRRIAAKKQEACARRGDLDMATVHFKYWDADKLLRYVVAFAISMIPMFIYIIACMSRYKSPWVYICYDLSVTLNAILTAVVFIGNEGWLSTYDSGFMPQMTSSLTQSTILPIVSCNSAPLRRLSQISNTSESQVESPCSQTTFDDFDSENLSSLTKTTHNGSGNNNSLPNVTSSAAAAAESSTTSKIPEQSRFFPAASSSSRTLGQLVFPTHSMSRVARTRRGGAGTEISYRHAAATVPQIVTDNFNAGSTHVISQTTSSPELKTVQIHTDNFNAGSTHVISQTTSSPELKTVQIHRTEPTTESSPLQLSKPLPLPPLSESLSSKVLPSTTHKPINNTQTMQSDSTTGANATNSQ